MPFFVPLNGINLLDEAIPRIKVHVLFHRREFSHVETFVVVVQFELLGRSGCLFLLLRNGLNR